MNKEEMIKRIEEIYNEKYAKLEPKARRRHALDERTEEMMHASLIYHMAEEKGPPNGFNKTMDEIRELAAQDFAIRQVIDETK